MKRILLAVITEADVCSVSFCASLSQSIKYGLSTQIEYFPVFFPSEGNWPMAFNAAVTLAWSEKLDGLICISPRVSWAPEYLLALSQTDKDAVALPVATRAGFNISLGEIARIQEDESSGEIKVKGASLDFFYLSQYAISRLCETHPSVKYRNQEIQLVLQSGDIYSDYYDPSDILVYRLREQGIETWLSAKYTAHRQDSVEYTNDFAAVLSELRANG